VFGIRIGFNADLDTIEILMLLDAFYINQLQLRAYFFHEVYTVTVPALYSLVESKEEQKDRQTGAF
jgi:hypothetical protein